MVATSKVVASSHRRGVMPLEQPQDSTKKTSSRRKQKHVLPSSIHMIASEYKEQEIVEALSQFLPPSTSTKRYCVDVGARCCSNKDNGSVSHWLLENSLHQPKQQHWSGVLIQPDSNLYKELRTLHDEMGNRCLQITPSSQEGLNERSLVWILRQFTRQLPSDFDLLCFSEGVRWNTYWVWRDFLECQTYQPRLVCAPFDASFPKDVAYVPPRGDKFGVPSVLALVEMAKEYRYQLVMTTVRCAFFVPHKLFQEHLRASVKNSTDTKSPRSPQQHLQESRDQLASSDRRALESPKREVIDTEAYITAGRQWLAERRSHLERDESKQRKATQAFKKQTTSAWQQRKVSIIDTLKRQSAKRRHSIQAKKRSSTPSRKAQDPPEEEPKKEVPNNQNIFTRLGNKTAEANCEDTRDVTPKRSNFRPDPPTTDNRIDVFPVHYPGNNDKGADAKSEEDDGVEISSEMRDVVKDWGTQHNKSNQESLAKSSRYFSETINRYRKTLSETKASRPEAKRDESLLSTHPAASVDDSSEEEILYSDEPLERLPMDANWGRVIDMKAHFGDVGGQSEEDMERAVRHLVARLRQEGYAFVRGTGVSRFVCQDALSASRLLLQEVDEKTRRSCSNDAGSSRGYSPLCTEDSGNTRLKDMVRKFRVGSKESKPSNIWPSDRSLDMETQEYIRTSLQTYHDEIREVALLLLECVCDGLSIENKYFDPISGHSSLGATALTSSLLTAMSCSRGNRHIADKPIVASHEDPALISIFLVDGGDCGSFQHKDVHGRWNSVEFPPATSEDPILLLYVGDSLCRLTNRFLPSLSRRVVPSNGHRSVNALFLSITRSLSDAPRHVMDPFSCWDRLEARGNDEDDSEDEGVLQRMALEKLASQLQEADTAFEESPSQVDENDDVQVVLDLASKLTKTKTSGKSESESTEYFSWFHPQQLLSRMYENKEKSSTAYEAQQIVRRCRSPSEGSLGLSLPNFEDSNDENDRTPKKQILHLKSMNPFRVAQNKLLSKYKDQKQTTRVDDRKRSRELAMLLPPLSKSHFSASTHADRETDSAQMQSGNRQQQHLALDVQRSFLHSHNKMIQRQKVIHDPIGAKLKGDFEDTEHRDLQSRTRGAEIVHQPGSLTHPIHIEGLVPSSSSLESDGEAEWAAQHITSSEINSTNSFSSINHANNKSSLLHSNFSSVVPVENARSLIASINKEDRRTEAGKDANVFSQQRDGAVDNFRSNELSSKLQEMTIKEKRQHFLPLGRKALSAETKQQPEPISPVHWNRALIEREDHEVSGKSKSTVVSMDDTVKQSEGVTSSFETIEASDVLDELLSAENGTQYEFVKAEEGREDTLKDKQKMTASTAITMLSHSGSTEPPMVGKLNLNRAKSRSSIEPLTWIGDRDTSARLENSVSASNSFLYNQTISFPQPKERVGTIKTKMMPGSTPELSPSHPQPVKTGNIKTKITMNPRQDEALIFSRQHGTANLDPESFLASSRLEQWQAEKTMLKNLHNLKWADRPTPTRREGEAASISSVSELTDDAHKIGCHIPVPWM
jgi:isopenicillin N synthase-like dioxygenase